MRLSQVQKHKWIIHWSVFSILVTLFVLTAVIYEDKNWVGNVLQTIGTVIGIYLTIIIFLHSKEESDNQFREHLEYLQNLNAKQIEALQSNTEKQVEALQSATEKQNSALRQETEKQIAASQNLVKEQIKTIQDLNEIQIETLKSSTNKQITTLQELNAKHIDALHRTTEKQIEALHRTTYDEISSFEKQTREVTDKLTDNSILLAEILGRELEKSMESFGNAVKREEVRYGNLSEWKFLRTQAQREYQLNEQWNRIQSFKKWYDYIVAKYNQVKNFLGTDQKKLND